MRAQQTKHKALFNSLDANEKNIREIFVNCDDVVFRRFRVGYPNQEALIVFVSSLVKKDLLDATILRELMGGAQTRFSATIEYIRKELVSASEVKLITTFEELEERVASGDALLLIDGDATGLSIGALGWEHRGIDKSENEVSIRGPQQAFTENMMNNVALVRRFIFGASLKVEKSTIGRVTRTPYCLVYHDKLVDPLVVQDVKKRLAKLEIDHVLDVGYLEELIRDHPWSPFPTINYSEKPDRIASQILSGKVAIFLENSPTAITCPALFVEFLQVPEDYYQNFIFQSGARIMRFAAFYVTLFLPSLYVAVIAYHHELIPLSLLTSMMQQRQGVPLPTVLEVLIMETTFEVLREAGLRLPRPFGQAVSIVGALVIGQAAVEASLVMPSTVIVVAATGIASFTIPGYSLSIGIRVLRFAVLIATGLFGLMGFLLSALLLVFHMVTLKSFGVMYTGGFAPKNSNDIQDTFLRLPYHHTKATTPWIGKRGGGRT